MVGIMSTTNKLRMEKCEDNIWERRVINSFPWSCQNGFLLAAFCWEHLTFHAKFPNKWKPKLQLVDQRCAGDFPPIPWCFPWKSPGWDDFPARTGILLQHWGSLRPGLFPSLHTRFSTLGLPVLSVGGSWRDVCVSQGLFLMPKDGDRAKIPKFFVAVMPSPPMPLPFVLPTDATTTAQGQTRRKRSQEGKTGSLFIQMPWQWIGCDYSLKYSLVWIIRGTGNRTNTGETQPR